MPYVVRSRSAGSRLFSPPPPRRCAPSPRRRAPPRRPSASRRSSARSSCPGRTAPCTPCRQAATSRRRVPGWHARARRAVGGRERVVLRRRPDRTSLSAAAGGDGGQHADVHRPHLSVVPVLRSQHRRGVGDLASRSSGRSPACADQSGGCSTSRRAPRGRPVKSLQLPSGALSTGAPRAGHLPLHRGRRRRRLARSTTCTSIPTCGAKNATTARERPPSHDGGR